MAAVASETLAYCTSCKIDLNHIVVAMKGDRIAKVQCLTCKKEHNYRTPKGLTTPKAPKAKSSRAGSKKSDTADTQHSTSIEAEWEKLMHSHRELPSKPYLAKGHFGLGDKINHPSFGDGIVGKLIYPNKLEVIFKTFIKILIHAGVSN
jgi:hypothetical protein